MNPLDTILPALVDSVFPIVKEIPCSMDYPLLFRLLNPVAYSGPAKRTGDASDD